MALSYNRVYVENQSTGKALEGVVVRVYFNGVLQNVFADESSTPLPTVLTGADGSAIYFVDGDGVYEEEYIYNGDILDRVKVPIFNPANYAAGADVTTILGATPATGHFGTFTGATIPDNVAAKPALQALETATELRPTSATLAASGGAALIGKQLSAGANLRTQTLSEYVEATQLQISQFSGADEQSKLVNALAEATESRNGGQGQMVLLPRGEFETTASFNLPNRGGLSGVNKRGTRIKANVAHAGPYMVTVDNGTSAMFDNPLQNLTLDCNDVASLGGVNSSAWQEGGGMDKVLVQKFRTYGARFGEMDGGAALCGITDSEFFGSASNCTAGILLTDPSLVGAFQLKIERTTIAGGGAAATSMPRAIDVVGGSLHVIASHVENCTTGIYLDGSGQHIINGFNGASSAGGVTNLVEIASTFTGTLTMIGCQRNGATNFLKDNRTGGFGTITGYDIPFLQISSEQPLSRGAVVASASIDGAAVTPAVTKGFGIASITDNGAGDYTLTLTRSAQAASDFTVFGSQNASGWVRCDLNGANSVRIRCYNAAGALADQNEIKVIVVRVA